MKKLLILLPAFFIQQLSAQTTWVKTHFVEYLLPPSHHDSTTVGPQELEIAPDGTIFSLMQIDQDHHYWLVALDSDGNIKWQRGAGHHGGIVFEDPNDLHTTSDNGCIYKLQHMGSLIIDSIFRLNSSGNVTWNKIYDGSSNGNHDFVNSITQTFYNTTYIQFLDSLVEFDSLGNFIRFTIPSSMYSEIFPMPDSNILRIYNDTLDKEDFYGSQFWSVYIGGSQTIKAAIPTTGNFFYLSTGTTIKKIDSNSGSVIWDHPDSAVSISITSDPGFVITSGNNLIKFDSSGTLQWSKNLPLPDFGLYCVGETPDHSFITGGTWRMYNQLYFVPIRYCPMMIKVDSTGNGNIDSTDFYWPGNANDNNVLSFGNDAVYIAAAMGNSGVQRDSLLLGGNFPVRNIYGTDWSDSFPAGFNYKYSDFDGNGIIDTNDIAQMAATLFTNYPPFSPHWTRQRFANNPELNFHVMNNHITIGDTLIIKVTLGTSSTPVDSIYGLSFDLHLATIIGYIQNDIYSEYSISPSALGDTSVNLYSYSFYNFNGGGITSTVLCRNDHQNAWVAGDTIATIIYYLTNIQYASDTVLLNVDWNAITVGGFPISLSVVSDSIFMSGINKINEFGNHGFEIYPNPAKENLTLNFRNNCPKEIRIFDLTGRNVFNTNSSSDKFTIDIKDLPDGIYYIKLITSTGTISKKFITIH